MKRLLVMMAVMLASSQAFSLEPESVNSVLDIFSIEFSESSGRGEDDSSEEKDESGERPYVLFVNTDEIYEATGVIGQELLIQENE